MEAGGTILTITLVGALIFVGSFMWWMYGRE